MNASWDSAELFVPTTMLTTEERRGKAMNGLTRAALTDPPLGISTPATTF